ncbi:Slm3p [Sugiyamaella lignohabitans]|uniref:tRNA-5-taurinomethyluridine 2-sulfurtransferase n=1 Tax=Sugiyamaella lignohabitans TaxID=796027 RepID=A0A161HIW6_9ASCO|nr:Slm3p [Sugiyamaella lignohabitans]ANB12547.1 Slm3p [Sugiyamaella lignohabitans]
MSSGVDSSTTAALLAKKYPGQVHGIYMCNWTATARCTEDEWNDVKEVSKVIGIPCHRVNLEKEYWTKVFEPMIDMYKNGLTPNPDVGCNRHIKFGALLQWASDHQKRLTGSPEGTKWWLATGHYARVGIPAARDGTNLEAKSNIHHLLRPKDLSKDQSYYLSTVLPESLNRVLFPLAAYTKPQIRQIAVDLDLPTASKPDSQGLCFVSQDHGHFKDFLEEYVVPTPGDIVTEDGKVVGKHQGLWQATIGQRSGVSMPQGDPECRGVWYVSDKRTAENQIVIVRGRDHPSIFRTTAQCSKFRWLGSDISLDDLSSIRVQFRSLQDQGLSVSDITVKNGIPGSSAVTDISVQFSEPARAVAPGQYLVLYQRDRVLGSGMIDFTR